MNGRFDPYGDQNVDELMNKEEVGKRMTASGGGKNRTIMFTNYCKHYKYLVALVAKKIMRKSRCVAVNGSFHPIK